AVAVRRAPGTDRPAGLVDGQRHAHRSLLAQPDGERVRPDRLGPGEESAGQAGWQQRGQQRVLGADGAPRGLDVYLTAALVEALHPGVLVDEAAGVHERLRQTCQVLARVEM